MCQACENLYKCNVCGNLENNEVFDTKPIKMGNEKVIYVIGYSYLALENDDFYFSTREFYATSAEDATSQCKKVFQYYDTVRIHTIHGPFQRVF